MQSGTPIESMAAAVHSAVLRDLPDIMYLSRKPGEDLSKSVEKVRRPRYDEISVYQFPQTWGSSALGFGGAGCASTTTADTTVVIEGKTTAAVYFGGRFAYLIDPFNNVFNEDLRAQNMAAVQDASKYQNVR